MHKIKQLRDELLEEIETYGGKVHTTEAAAHVKCLASAADHLDNLVRHAEEDEEEYSSRGMSRRMSRRADPMYESYDDGMSGRRDNRGRFAVERGRSYSDGTEEEVERLMQKAQDEHTRRALQTALQTIRG